MKHGDFNMNLINKIFLTVLIVTLFLMSCTYKDNTDTVKDNTGVGVVFWSSDIGSETTNQLLIDTKQKRAFFDFDSESIDATELSDIYFFVSCGSDCFYRIMAVNGAKISDFFQNKKNNYTDCEVLLNELDQKDSIEVIVNNYACLQTNKGNIVQIYFNSINGSTDGVQISFDYVVWSK